MNDKELKLKCISVEPPNDDTTTASIQEIMDDVTKTLNEKYGEGKWHCDDLWAEGNLPQCLQEWLDIKRAPAIDQVGKTVKNLFATYKGKRVKINMASRFGDLGITSDLRSDRGYDDRGIYIPDLTDFSNSSSSASK